MSAIEDFAHAAATNACEVETKAFDPMLIVAIVTAIVNLVINCRKTPTLEDVKSPGVIQRWALKRAIRASLNDPAMEREYFRGIFTAMLAKGQDLTEESLQAILTEAQLEAGIL